MTIEHGGGLSDLGWFIFFHHLSDECQTRFIAIKLRWGVSATPSTNHELKRSSKKIDFGQVHFACVTIKLGGGLLGLELGAYSITTKFVNNFRKIEFIL